MIAQHGYRALANMAAQPKRARTYGIDDDGQEGQRETVENSSKCYTWLLKLILMAAESLESQKKRLTDRRRCLAL